MRHTFCTSSSEFFTVTDKAYYDFRLICTSGRYRFLTCQDPKAVRITGIVGAGTKGRAGELVVGVVFEWGAGVYGRRPLGDLSAVPVTCNR